MAVDKDWLQLAKSILLHNSKLLDEFLAGGDMRGIFSRKGGIAQNLNSSFPELTRAGEKTGDGFFPMCRIRFANSSEYGVKIRRLSFAQQKQSLRVFLK